MRIMFTWITAVVLCTTITIGWYVGLLLVTQISSSLEVQFGAGQGLQLATLINYVAIAWGPLFDILVIVWAFASSQGRDIQSEYV